jgi:hypothetical protein
MQKPAPDDALEVGPPVKPEKRRLSSRPHPFRVPRALVLPDLHDEPLAEI